VIRQAKQEDIVEVMPHLTPDELTRFILAGLNPREALKKVLGGQTYTGLVQGKVACMFGIKFSENIGEFPTLWLIKTPELRGSNVRFLRENQRFVKWAVDKFGPLESCVAEENKVSRKWLEWLGFHEIEDLKGFVRMRKNA
jgi:hypothetical protein